MILDKPITLRPNSYTDPATNARIDPKPFTTNTLEVVYIDNPQVEQYMISIKGIPHPVVLWEAQDYHQQPHFSRELARARFLELSENDPESYLQKFFPRTLEDDPTGPGTMLHGMFSALGIKAGPNCSCKRHAIEMNTKGADWCEANIDTILGWLKQESEKRKIPFVETVARMVVNRAISKSRKYSVGG